MAAATLASSAISSAISSTTKHTVANAIASTGSSTSTASAGAIICTWPPTFSARSATKPPAATASPTVTAALLYRSYPLDLAAERGWEMTERVMTTAEVQP